MGRQTGAGSGRTMVADVYPVIREGCTQVSRNKWETSGFLFQFQKCWGGETRCIFLKFAVDRGTGFCVCYWCGNACVTVGYRTALVCYPQIFGVLPGKRTQEFVNTVAVVSVCAVHPQGLANGTLLSSFIFAFLFCLGSGVTALLYSGAEIDLNWQLGVIRE